MHLADHSQYSRNRLGDPVMGCEARDRNAMVTGSDSLHRALWREHPRILAQLGAVKVGKRT